MINDKPPQRTSSNEKDVRYPQKEIAVSRDKWARDTKEQLEELETYARNDEAAARGRIARVAGTWWLFSLVLLFLVASIGTALLIYYLLIECCGNNHLSHAIITVSLIAGAFGIAFATLSYFNNKNSQQDGMNSTVLERILTALTKSRADQ